MKHLAANTPPSMKHVAVLVAPDDALLAELFRHYTPHYLQLHHLTDARRIDAISQRFHVPVITAISIRSDEDLGGLDALEAVSAHVLFDAKNFGSGQAFDWNILANKKNQKPWFLAGGLHAGNVTEAIRVTGAPMVDVSSGIESAPGIKSPEKIADFYRAVLEARP
jgi:phosphoribosylanthranilate isomerase